MTILTAGSFRTSDYRKNIPSWVKVVAATKARPCYLLHDDLVSWARGLRYDHRPPLKNRDYDLETNDFVPPQNDSYYIEAISCKDHDHRTFGRKPDAEKVVTTRGSDLGEAARTKHIMDSEKLHAAKMAMKRGNPEEIADILGGVKQKSRLRPKRKIPSKPFPKQNKRAA
jgi:hypothetical protein